MKATHLPCCAIALLAARARRIGRRTPSSRRCNTPRGSSAAATRVPLTPGTALAGRGQAAHRRRTRACSCRLAEGSAVKLGENAQFVIERRCEDAASSARRSRCSRARSASPPTRCARSPAARHRIKVKNVTAGIRGTDLWGKSTGRARPRVPDRGQDQRGRRGPSDGHARPAARFLPEAARRRAGGREGGREAGRELGAETEISKDGAARRARAASGA